MSPTGDNDRGFEAPLPRFASRGRAFVYVVPCRDDTLFKIGFSRDPLERFHTLHRRFFAFFDLDLAVLAETSRVREARALERELLSMMARYTALAPPVVPAAAAGHNEWFRGALDEAREAAINEARTGMLVVHDPASAWFRDRLGEGRDRLYGWSARVLEAIAYARNHPESGDLLQARRFEAVLEDTLDAYASLGIDPRPFVPPEVQRWYEILIERRPGGSVSVNR